MSYEYRLVVKQTETHYGDVPLTHRVYVLQRCGITGVWETLPVVSYDQLPADERAEIVRHFSKKE